MSFDHVVVHFADEMEEIDFELNILKIREALESIAESLEAMRG